MKVCETSRVGLYQLLSFAFKKMGVRPKLAEIGVLKGENAKVMFDLFEPEQLYLVDPWAPYQGLHYFEEQPYYISENSEFVQGYFGGPINEPETFNKLYQQCLDRFQGSGNVSFVRQDSYKGLDQVKEALLRDYETDKLDLVYIDGNHEYNHVLRDLMYWQEFVSASGVLMLNDCCHNAAGFAINLGVLQAVITFIKQTDFYPILLTNTDWSDIVLVKKGSMMASMINEVVRNSNLGYVEVPHQLLGSMRVVNGAQRSNIIFD